jgi:hypothetical protein
MKRSDISSISWKTYGMMASFIRTASAPPTPRSSAVTGSPFLSKPMTIRPRRSRMSFRLVVSARIAIISLATYKYLDCQQNSRRYPELMLVMILTVISKPVVRDFPFSVSFIPTTTLRKKRSHVSSTRCLQKHSLDNASYEYVYFMTYHVMVDSSMSKRANLEISSSVKSSGLTLLMPNFFRRVNITGENLRLPSLAFGQSRLNRACDILIVIMCLKEPFVHGCIPDLFGWLRETCVCQ